MRLLDARIHGVFDLVLVIVFLLGPLAFGFGGSPAAMPARRFSTLVGAAVLVIWILTDYRGSRQDSVRA
jgi:hypothetical protein